MGADNRKCAIARENLQEKVARIACWRLPSIVMASANRRCSEHHMANGSSQTRASRSPSSVRSPNTSSWLVEALLP